MAPITASGKGEQAKQRCQQTQPQQRQGQIIGQQLVMQVDDAGGQQNPGAQQRRRCRPAKAKLPGDDSGQQTAGRFHQWILDADRPLAMGAAAALAQIAEQRNIFQRGDQVATVRALRTRPPQAQARCCIRCRLAEQFAALRPPLTLHDQRQAIDHHIEKAADHQAEQHGQDDEQRRRFGKQRSKAHLRPPPPA
jgi:hypothetical protein